LSLRLQIAHQLFGVCTPPHPSLCVSSQLRGGGEAEQRGGVAFQDGARLVFGDSGIGDGDVVDGRAKTSPAS
jgi:hypothetical protein